MVLATNLGFPRIGIDRELKKATESYWKGKISQKDLLNEAHTLRLKNWKIQRDAGLHHIPSNDFSFYDQVLDMACTLGCVPSRYGWDGGDIDLDLYFAMARGRQGVTAMEMTKWFDTNYHYIVPEFEEDQEFKLSSTKIIDEFREAKEAGINTRPVLIGPISFLLMGKKKAGVEACRSTFAPALVTVYSEILKKLHDEGVEWVQIDEPYLAMDLKDRYKDAFKTTYQAIKDAVPDLNILVTTYFEGLRENIDLACSLPVKALHLDLHRAPEQLEQVLEKLPSDMALSLGLVDGRNIWKTNLSKALKIAEKAVAALGPERVLIGPSCSLLHSPIDLERETGLDPQIKNWLSFARQKLDEIVLLAKGAEQGQAAIEAALAESDRIVEDRATSERIHNKEVKARLAAVNTDMTKRRNVFKIRRERQQEALNLPAFPTTTIGSFPQTKEIRQARAAYKKGDLDQVSYEAAMKNEIQTVIRYQEEAGLDVLVHGEPERNDMVEYFGEQLSGFTFTSNGWVQSYGSRCVKPPVIFGDVSRPEPMTVVWSAYAQSLTKKPMKGMLTGPITILCWSFVRDDQPRSETCKQIALAIRDEVLDLEKAGIGVIQIDEPAIREGMPLRRSDWDSYLKWAVESFRLASAGVEDKTQIHTHMCYSEFNDIINSIAALDADVISMETSRSQMELLEAFVTYNYPNDIGPGVYDIHSPRIPTVEEMVALLEKAAEVLSASQLWVNPDCGLKTRGWAEVKPALENMVAAARTLRQQIKKSAAA